MNLVDEPQEIVGRITFDVELDLKLLREEPQLADIARSRVSLVGPRMHGDPGRSRRNTKSRHAADVGQSVVARVAQ